MARIDAVAVGVRPNFDRDSARPASDEHTSQGLRPSKSSFNSFNLTQNTGKNFNPSNPKQNRKTSQF